MERRLHRPVTSGESFIKTFWSITLSLTKIQQFLIFSCALENQGEINLKAQALKDRLSYSAQHTSFNILFIFITVHLFSNGKNVFSAMDHNSHTLMYLQQSTYLIN